MPKSSDNEASDISFDSDPKNRQSVIFCSKKVPNFFNLLSLKKREKMGRSNFVFILVFAGGLALASAHVNVSQGSVLSFTQILLVMVASRLEVT